MRFGLWGRMASCSGLLTRLGWRRLSIGAQVINLPHRSLLCIR